MLKFSSFLCLSLIASTAFSAKPCWYRHSCLKLNNQYEQAIRIDCNGLEQIEALGGAQSSIQLDLGYGDGLGAPDPRQIYCKLTYINGKSNNVFNFNNPYWGSVIDFHLVAEKRLEIQVSDGWSSAKTHYTFTW
ncbi:Uncharacterised protein [Legionella beliardensis]|uniref:Secreted protein n=1 Tax=Legionella beliardensis TaxID=91822 RepID=A0A378I5Y7_9GAMM|nr:C2 domain-containing protein [Legionella beliardensis]STX27884.1 Uncharacterised protein [Legionella beliardensis]